MKIKLTPRIWILIIFLVLSLISIFSLPPTFLQKGVLIISVEPNSTAYNIGLRENQIITSIDSMKINSIDDFSNYIQTKFIGNSSVRVDFITNEGDFVYYSNSLPEITISKIPPTRLKLGLDLVGGARALIKAKNQSLDDSQIKDLIDVTSNRINVYGISDVKVAPVSDLSGENYMLIEVAGATPKDLRQLIEQQGKFEAKIGNETVFIGGERDISSVCRNDAQCAYIESCNQNPEGGYFCTFRFSVYLSEAAAERHAAITSKLDVNTTSSGRYLSKNLDLYLDNKLVDSLLIGESLKGRTATQISISGSGTGETQEDAYAAAEDSMHKLQTILITGSLPYELEIVKLDTISPALGEEFTKLILLAGLVALLMVTIIIFARYRKFKSSIALIFISLSEIIIILGVAALIEWNLDLPSIAGILATVGTGLDDLIILVDESKKAVMSLKQRLKRAFAIILGAYFTSVVALLPLMWAGAGLLKGFAVTTLIGITVGILITRPAFSDIIRKIEKD